VSPSDSDKGTSTDASSSPRLIDPESRTTAYPVIRAGAFTNAVWPSKEARRARPAAPSASIRAPANDGGWRASQR
jgi:hypothetical protein